MKSEQELISVFEKLREALIKCDQDQLKTLISDDYQGFSLNGTIENKELILQTYQPELIELSRYTVEYMECEVSANLGIITGKGEIKGKFGELDFQHEVLFTDIFKFMEKRWQYYRSQVTEINRA
jgi:hypothetical protein